MANFGTYATLAQLRHDLTKQSADTADDASLLTAAESASRQVDEWCKRHFQPRSETRTLSPVNASFLLLDEDLLSLTSLKSDEDEDYDYDYTWAATDYWLWPLNGLPKWGIKIKRGGNYTLPVGDGTIQIVGVWGYGDGETAASYVDSTTDTAEALDASETGVDVVSGTPFSAGQCILVDSEQMYVTAVATNTLTVVRGVNGTTAATHDSGASVNVYRYPQDVVTATIRLAQREFRLQSVPFGVAGGGDMGSQDVNAGQGDRDIWGKLGPYRRMAVG